MVQTQQLIVVIKFMLGRMLDAHYNRTHPASWGYILRELRKAGMCVEDEALMSFQDYKDEALKELRECFCPRCVFESDPESPECRTHITFDMKYTDAVCNQYHLKRRDRH